MVQLEVWVHYDSETGYVWPQVYESKDEAFLDEKMNHPHKALRLRSDPYEYDPKKSNVSGSFGTEVPVARTRSRSKK